MFRILSKSAIVLICMLAANTVHAQALTAPVGTTASVGTSAQNNRMKACAQQYHTQNLPKSQYKTFMSSCLKTGSTVAIGTASASPATANATAATAATAVAGTSATAPVGTSSQQNKMKTCNAQAKTQNLTGTDRKTFMKTCLSNAQ